MAVVLTGKLTNLLNEDVADCALCIGLVDIGEETPIKIRGRFLLTDLEIPARETRAFRKCLTWKGLPPHKVLHAAYDDIMPCLVSVLARDEDYGGDLAHDNRQAWFW